MKKVLLLFIVSAVLVPLLASVALAQQLDEICEEPPCQAVPMSASPTATATASPTAMATGLAQTGGPPLVGPVTLVASLTLLTSGVGALVLLRRTVS